jgi:FkbM family methyltransferase
MQTYLKDCKWGRFLLLQGDMVSQYADIYGQWCEQEVDLFARLLGPESNVLEVGAHIGLHAVALSALAPRGKVVCFEPQRALFQVLCANCALNGRTNVHAYNQGVGNRSGTVDVACTDYETPWNYGSFSIDRGFDTEGAFHGATWSEPVEMVTLDTAPATATIDSLRLLKIDVEGLEAQVIEGGRGLIEELQPVLFVENNKEDKGDALIAAVRELGYECYWYCSERYAPDNYNRVERRVPGVDINMACFPAGADGAGLGLMKVRRFDDLKSGTVRLVAGH